MNLQNEINQIFQENYNYKQLKNIKFYDFQNFIESKIGSID